MKILRATPDAAQIELTESEMRDVRVALAHSNNEHLRWEFTKAIVSVLDAAATPKEET